MIKFNIGISNEQIDHKNQTDFINDTSDIKFDFVSKSPVISYSHEFIFSDRLSISGKLGYQYMNIFYNNQHYGSPYVFGSVNPQLSIFYKKHFEYYIKLQIGMSYWFNRPELLEERARRIFPEKATVFTGITIGGFNYYLTEKLGLNMELSIWSPELLTVGLSYRFFKGEIPSIQELQGY